MSDRAWGIIVMSRWIRFTTNGQSGFGMLVGDIIDVHVGDMFDEPTSTGTSLRLGDVTVAMPCNPSKFIALWNNYHAQAIKQSLPIPAEPLYFLKAANSYCGHDETVEIPSSYAGRVVYEGELGLVIGRRCRNATLDEAKAAIFGYTCVNDLTALDLLNKDPSFAQWTRAKSFDRFGVFGPCIATGLSPQELTVRTLINGRERQNYACSDMIFSPEALVQALSHDMTLLPGDLIACGTSLGVLPIKPGTVVEVVIEGIGLLKSTLVTS
jgi:2-keto-4-pentenoate hydratase/2-oxohepta-3-ene-1,7-dioic acid hydratase in catechol pathway